MADSVLSDTLTDVSLGPSEQSQTQSPLFRIPTEVRLGVYKYLPYDDARRMCLTCKLVSKEVQGGLHELLDLRDTVRPSTKEMTDRLLSLIVLITVGDIYTSGEADHSQEKDTATLAAWDRDQELQRSRHNIPSHSHTMYIGYCKSDGGESASPLQSRRIPFDLLEEADAKILFTSHPVSDTPVYYQYMYASPKGPQLKSVTKALIQIADFEKGQRKLSFEVGHHNNPKELHQGYILSSIEPLEETGVIESMASVLEKANMQYFTLVLDSGKGAYDESSCDAAVEGVKAHFRAQHEWEEKAMAGYIGRLNVRLASIGDGSIYGQGLQMHQSAKARLSSDRQLQS